MQARSVMSDQRSSHRHLVRLKAHVKFLGRARVACEIHNISSTGALLVFPAAVTLPSTFRLDVDEDLFEAQCEVRHHSGCKYGVRFTTNIQGAMARYG